MYKFEVPHHFGLPEMQLRTDGILVEVSNFVPREVDTECCFSHHLLVSWLSPQPVMGKCHFGIPDSTSRLSDFGNLAFIPADVHTHSRYLPSTRQHRAIAVRIAPHFFESLSEDEKFSFDPQLMARLNIRDPDILVGMRQLAKEAEAPGFASATLVESIGANLVVRLARNFCQAQRDDSAIRGGLAPWQLRRITELVEYESTSNNIPSVAELAKLVGISTSHLRRAFKNSTGSTIGDHIRKVQFERARSLLCVTDLTLKEIATRLGFSSHYGFTLAFQRSAGETPSAYRQRLRSRNYN